MKKCLFVAAIAALVFAVNAKAQFSVGVGYANEKVTTKTSTDLGANVKGYAWSKERTHLDGFYVEASYNWDFTSIGSGALALQPGIRYTMLTSLQSSASANLKGDGDKIIASEKSRYSNHLLDIPVNVKYSYEFVPGSLKAYVFAGPVFSFGLSASEISVAKGKSNIDGESDKYYSSEKYNVYTGKYTVKAYNPETKKYDVETNKDDLYKDYNAFDLKLGLGAGVTLCDKVDVKFGYNIGLLNRSFVKNRDSEKYSAHSNIMYFGVAYNF